MSLERYDRIEPDARARDRAHRRHGRVRGRYLRVRSHDRGCGLVLGDGTNGELGNNSRRQPVPVQVTD